MTRCRVTTVGSAFCCSESGTGRGTDWRPALAGLFLDRFCIIVIDLGQPNKVDTWHFRNQIGHLFWSLIWGLFYFFAHRFNTNLSCRWMGLLYVSSRISSSLPAPPTSAPGSVEPCLLLPPPHFVHCLLFQRPPDGKRPESCVTLRRTSPRRTT